MKLTVRKDRCPVCEPSMRGWLVTDHRGNFCYFSWDWRQAVNYACSATQPGTGVQVQPTKRVSHA